MNKLVPPTSYPSPGQRIRLRRPVERSDLFVASPGLTGFIVQIDPEPGADFISAYMDQVLSNNPGKQAQIEREYNNCLHWRPVNLPGSSCSALSAFLADCEYLAPYPLEDLVLRAPGQNLDGRLADGRTCNVLKSFTRDWWIASVYSLDKPRPDRRWEARFSAELIARGRELYAIDLTTLLPK